MFRLPLVQGCTSVQAGEQLAGGANDAHQTTALQVEQRQVVNVGEAPHRVLNLYRHSDETHYTTCSTRQAKGLDVRVVRPLIFEERTGTEEVGLQAPLRPLERPQPPAPMHVPPSFGANVFLM